MKSCISHLPTKEVSEQGQPGGGNTPDSSLSSFYYVVMNIFLIMVPVRLDTKPYYYTSQIHSSFMASVLVVYSACLFSMSTYWRKVISHLPALSSMLTPSTKPSLSILGYRPSIVVSVPLPYLFIFNELFMQTELSYLLSYSLPVHPHQNGSFIKAETVSAFSGSLLNF